MLQWRLQSQGLDVNTVINKDTLPQIQESLRPDAILRVKRTLALAEIAKMESIQVDPDALEERYQEVASELSDRKVDSGRLRTFLADELLEADVIKWLKEHAQITFVEAKATADSETPKDSSSVAEPAVEPTPDRVIETVAEVVDEDDETDNQ